MYEFKMKDEPFGRGFVQEPSSNLCKKIAAGQLLFAKEADLGLYEGVGLPNSWYNGYACVFGYGCGISGNAGWLDFKGTETPEFKDEYEILKKEFVKYNINIGFDTYYTDHEKDIIGTFAGWGGNWSGHSVPSFINVAKFGTDGLREKIRTYKAKNTQSEEFYDGLLMYLDALDIMGKRTGEKAAARAAETDNEADRKKLLRLAKSFESCPKAPAKTFPDACAVYVMMFTNDGVDSPGYFDQYMIDFWRATPYEEAREMLEDMWEFFHFTRTWNLCIGGSDENWQDRSNELSYEILDVTAKFKYQTPNLTMRVHRNTPEKLYRAAYKAIASGCGMPTMYNDEVVCPSLESLGIPPCDSHLYVMNGCNQIDIQGKSHMGLEDGEVNIGKAVELAFNDGKCTITGKQLGAHTGDPASFDTFEKFYDAVRTQIHFLINTITTMSNKGQLVLRERMASPARSLTTEGCIEKGIDYKSGGPLYGHGQILAEGVAECIDSVAAVKKHVYEDGKYTIAEMADAIVTDFEGRDEMAAFLRKSELRFGNDIDYVDAIGAEIVDDYNRYLLQIPTVRGGRFGGGCSPFVRAADNGMRTGALPNGKRRGELLYADSIGATPGRDINGPTALLKSCLRFNHKLATSGFILNIKFDKKLFNTAKGEEAFLALCHTYFDNAGQQLSVTVVSKDELIDAKKNPDNHRDLIVRVGGYSDYFVNLPEGLQDNIIARTDYEI